MADAELPIEPVSAAPAGQAGRGCTIDARREGSPCRADDAPERRQRGDRRQSDGEPPEGMPDRRRGRRRASDVPKPPCPWCGCASSSVYRSAKHGWKAGEGYQRRRQCAECGGGWPTTEELDESRFVRELAARGLERVNGVIRPTPRSSHGED